MALNDLRGLTSYFALLLESAIESNSIKYLEGYELKVKRQSESAS